MMPLSTLENTGGFQRNGAGLRGFIGKTWEGSPPDGSNMSPFTRGGQVLEGKDVAFPTALGNQYRDQDHDH